MFDSPVEKTTLTRHVPALSVPASHRFYHAVEAIGDTLGELNPKFMDQLLEAPIETFIPTLRFYALTGQAEIIYPKGHPMFTAKDLEEATRQAAVTLTPEQAENIWVTTHHGDYINRDTLLDLVEQTVGDALENLHASTPANVAVSDLLSNYSTEALYDFAHFAKADFEVQGYRLDGAGL